MPPFKTVVSGLIIRITSKFVVDTTILIPTVLNQTPNITTNQVIILHEAAATTGVNESTPFAGLVPQELPGDDGFPAAHTHTLFHFDLELFQALLQLLHLIRFHSLEFVHSLSHPFKCSRIGTMSVPSF